MYSALHPLQAGKRRSKHLSMLSVYTHQAAQQRTLRGIEWDQQHQGAPSTAYPAPPAQQAPRSRVADGTSAASRAQEQVASSRDLTYR